MTDVVVTLEREPQLAPLQPAPDRDQVTPAFATSLPIVAEKFCVCCVCTAVAPGETLTVMAGSIVTAAAEVRAGSATEVAMTVTDPGGTAAGAVYKPVAEIVPQVAPEQAVPESDHVTPLFCESLDTVAENCLLRETFNEKAAGETLTETGELSVTVTAAVFELSALATAVRVTVLGTG